MSLFKDYTIILPPEVENKIMYWIDKAPTEISGLGDAYLDNDNKLIRITSAFLLKQECTGTETELDEKSIASAMYKSHLDAQNGIERNIKFWWHSHVNMAVFWSGTDVNAMTKLGSNGWFAHIVLNKKNEKRGAISYPLTLESSGLTVSYIQTDDDLLIRNSAPIVGEETKILDKEYDDNYKEKKYTYHYQANSDQTNFPKKITDEELDAWLLGRREKENGKRLVHPNSQQNLLPVPSDDEVLFENKQLMLFFNSQNHLMLQRNNKICNLEFQPQRFPTGIIDELTDQALQIICDEVETWQDGKGLEQLRELLGHEFLNRETAREMRGGK